MVKWSSFIIIIYYLYSLLIIAYGIFSRWVVYLPFDPVVLLQHCRRGLCHQRQEVEQHGGSEVRMMDIVIIEETTTISYSQSSPQQYLLVTFCVLSVITVDDRDPLRPFLCFRSKDLCYQSKLEASFQYLCIRASPLPVLIYNSD